MSQGALYEAIYSAVLGVWTGALGPAQGQSAIVGAVQTYLQDAWEEGAALCGITRGELTEEEIAAMWNFIFTQQAFAGRLANDVWMHRQATGGKLEAFTGRLNIWAQRYHHARELARSMACADQKAVWVYGDTKAHCEDCSRAAGRVHRRSIWRKYGWVPGSTALACGGWHCDCRLEDTDEHAWPGHPPYLSRG